MATDRGLATFIMDQLYGLQAACRPMMGEYVLYVDGKVVGGIYDDRLLVKPTSSALAMMPDAARELPYPGAKEMLLVDRVEDRDYLQTLLTSVAGDLPAPKKRRKS
ncbi:MAG: competence protein TfoX [Oscillospiraceae bacterium]|nr:competence protein TfoX [Oscillospiraceae bacterium]